MISATAYAKQDLPVILDDLDALERFRVEVSLRVAADRPLIVTFDSHHCSVYLGLTEDQGFVHVVSEPDGPPYMITVGDGARPGAVDFFLHGEHHTEVMAKHLVPIADAWSAVRRFIESGDLLPSLRWDEV